MIFLSCVQRLYKPRQSSVGRSVGRSVSRCLLGARDLWRSPLFHYIDPRSRHFISSHHVLRKQFCFNRTFWFFGPCKCYEPDPSQEKRWYLLKGQYFKDWPDDVDDVCNDPFLQPALWPSPRFRTTKQRHDNDKESWIPQSSRVDHEWRVPKVITRKFQ